MEDYHTKRAHLLAVYAAHEKVTGKFHFACQPGCCSCCTQSVALTTLEGLEIVRFLQETKEEPLLNRLPPERCRPLYTPNRYARLFLDKEEHPDEEVEPWNLAPCIFLADGRCAIYPVRPFDCRCMLSREKCSASGSAEILPALLTVNIITRQIIEHIAQGGYWGNLYDILDYLSRGLHDHASGNREASARDAGQFSLLPAEPSPGFLVLPEERRIIGNYLAILSGSDPGGDLFRTIVGNAALGKCV